MLKLFDDQQRSIKELRQVMGSGCRNVLLQGSTGSGKTVMSTAIVASAMNKGSRVMFIVPRKDLIRQVSGTFYEFGISHSFIASGREYISTAQAHIASKDTLNRRLDKVRAPDLAIIDETHYGGNSLGVIVDWLKKNGSYIIGLTATPWLLSGKGLGCWYDEMVCGPSIRWLIDNKRLSDYRAFAPSAPDLSGIKVTGGDYNKGQLSHRMEDVVLIGDAVQHYKQHAMGKLGVTFAVSRRHSQMLAEAYNSNGIAAAHVDGETPMDERLKIFKAYARGELKQLCNAELLTFGFDIASASGNKDVTVECITDCAPTKSLSKQLQKWGRGLRYDPSPHFIFDHASNIQTHGLPCGHRDWQLEDWRKQQRQKQERDVPVRQCPECYFCFPPAEICPHCKYEFPVKYRTVDEIEGELKELNRIEEEKRQAEKKRARQTVGRASTMDELWAIAKERGYKPGWVYVTAKRKGIRA